MADELKSVISPPVHKLRVDEAFDSVSTLPKVETLEKYFLQEGRLSEDAALKIINEGAELMRKEGNVLHLESPVTICGDIHGQFYDLIKLFEVGGKIGEVKYLFLGDYVDRGSFSIECVLYLMALKLTYPEKIHLLRGNHECRHLTEHFTFKRECEVKYTIRVYDACMTAFDCLPLSALVDKKYLCVHGGISPQIETIEDIEKLDRFMEPPTSGPMCDLLWSDPVSEFNLDEGNRKFMPNSVRGCSYSYSFKACCDFIQRNNLLSIIRAHEVQAEGFLLSKNNEKTKFPALITIFSAPNYLDQYQNKGAVIKFDGKEMNIRQFRESPHPYWLPNFMDAFTWSLPFAVERITEMLTATFNVCSDEELEKEEMTNERNNRLKKKIASLATLTKVCSVLRENRECSIKLDGLAPVLSDTRSPKKLLDSRQGRKSSFDDAKELDLINEKMPETKSLP